MNLISLFNSIAFASDDIATMKCFKCLPIQMNGDIGTITFVTKAMCVELEFKYDSNVNQIEINRLKINMYGKEQKSNRKNICSYASREYSQTGT